jgi:hypothetical protein
MEKPALAGRQQRMDAKEVLNTLNGVPTAPLMAKKLSCDAHKTCFNRVAVGSPEPLLS